MFTFNRVDINKLKSRSAKHGKTSQQVRSCSRWKLKGFVSRGSSKYNFQHFTGAPLLCPLILKMTKMTTASGLHFRVSNFDQPFEALFPQHHSRLASRGKSCGLPPLTVETLEACDLELPSAIITKTWLNPRSDELSTTIHGSLGQRETSEFQFRATPLGYRWAPSRRCFGTTAPHCASSSAKGRCPCRA